MKPVACRLFFALALALCFLACPRKDENIPPPSSTAKEKEPNNQASQAQKLTHDIILEAEISVGAQERDEDWFWLPAVAERWAHIEAIPSPGVDLALEVMTPEGEVLLRTDHVGLGGVESIPNLGLSQPCFFRVVSAKDGSGGSYQLRVRFVDAVPGHEAEPNNRLPEAILVPLDTPQQGTLSTADDTDWFRFEVPLRFVPADPAPAEILSDTPPTPSMPNAVEAKPSAEPEAVPKPVAEVTPRRIAVEVEADAAAAIEIQLCDDKGKPLVQTRPEHKGSWVVRNFALPPNLSSVALMIEPLAATKAKTPFVPISYRLKLFLEKDDSSFEAEPNDTPSQATPLFHGRETEALLSPATDVDYFRVDVAQASLVNVELSALEGVDLQLLAIAPANADTKEAERVLLRSNEGKANEAERLLNVQCNTTCYFKVESVAQKVSDKWIKTQENPKTPYRIRVHVQEDSQRREREPNNSAGQATELSMGQNVRGYIYPKEDVDFFRVDLSRNLVRKPILATLFGLPKNSLGLWLHRLDNEGKLELVQTAPVPPKDRPTVLRYSAVPGVYFLEVKDPRKRESNFQDEYQLRIDLDDSN
jgi:hypothetical protein